MTTEELLKSRWGPELTGHQTARETLESLAAIRAVLGNRKTYPAEEVAAFIDRLNRKGYP